MPGGEEPRADSKDNHGRTAFGEKAKGDDNITTIIEHLVVVEGRHDRIVMHTGSPILNKRKKRWLNVHRSFSNLYYRPASTSEGGVAIAGEGDASCRIWNSTLH